MAGISERTARAVVKDPRLPSQNQAKRSWRTRLDPLVAVWPRTLEMLNGPAGLMTVSIFEVLQEEFGDGMPTSFTAPPQQQGLFWIPGKMKRRRRFDAVER